MIYKEKLKSLRESKNLTQEDIGKLINIGRKGYNHIETEYTIISIEKLNILCNYYNVSFDYIFNFTDKINYNKSKKEINIKLLTIRLKKFRKENKLTLMKLGDILKCSYGTLAGYEKGRYLISTAILFDLCKKYNLSADYLLGKINEPKNSSK